MDDESGSLKILRTKDWLKINSSRLFILYFSDPRSHWVYRKSKYYQGGMRCCLMSLLLHVLSDMVQNPQLLSQIHIWPKPKAKIGHTDSFYPAPPSSDVIATAKTLINSVSPMGSRSHRDGLANSLLPTAITSVSLRYAIGPTEFAWPTLCFAYYPNPSHRVWVIGQTEFWIYPDPSTSVPPKTLTVTRFAESVRPSL